ncbi:MAG: SPOR domain-containing protein [Bacteroidales bacterium]|nr:SPOR domain-containing protein [Bacteroidales bacterium]
MNVAADLFEYLHNFDKAELPGLGTFYVQKQSATISSLTGTIEPPCRKLTFKNEELGDLSFVKNMAEKEFISEQTALVWVKQYTESLREKLDAGQKCKVGELGEFSKDFAGNYVFNASDVNLLDDAYAFKTLKGVKTFDVERVVEPIRTKEPQIEVEQTEQASIEINEEKLPEPEAVMPTEPKVEREFVSPDLPKETVSHTEAVVAAELETPETEKEIETTLAVEETPEAEAELKPIEKEVEIEEIKPQSEDLRAQAQAIIDENKRRKEEEKEAERLAKEEKKRKKKAKKRRKRIMVTVLCILLFLLLCCGGFVAAFYFNLLPDKPFLKPITEKLAYYIKPQAKHVQLAAPIVVEETPVEELQETETLEETMTIEQEVIEVEEKVVEAPKPQAKKQTQTTAKATTKTKTKKETKEETPTKPATPEVDNASPVVVQNYSRLGFDVIGGSFSSRANAERLARKAKSLGYDSYVLSKVKSGTPIYYVSYGSRRTLKEANDLMARMVENLGGEYYVISR